MCVSFLTAEASTLVCACMFIWLSVDIALVSETNGYSYVCIVYAHISIYVYAYVS